MLKIFSDLKMNQKQVVILIILTTLIAFLLYINLLLRPQVAMIVRIFSDVRNVSADLKGAQALIARTDEMRRSVEAFDKKIGRYEKTLPTEQGLPGLLEDLSNMARTSNMRIVGIVPIFDKEAVVRPGQAYKEIPIAISVRSGYHELGRFLASLENCDRFMKVADILIRSNRVNPKKHDVELLVLTYVLLGGK